MNEEDDEESRAAMGATASSELSGTVSSLDKSVASNVLNEATGGSIGTESMESKQQITSNLLTGTASTISKSDGVISNQSVTTEGKLIS